MKKLYFLLLILLITATSFGQTILLLEDFNTADTPLYSTPTMAEQIVNSTAYFTRTDGTNIATPISFTDGEQYFAVQDIDTSPMSSPATMLFDDINIATYTNLIFVVGLAEHDAADGMEDWDNDDFVHFDYQIDNSGTWKNLVWVENGGTADSAPQIDTDFNGIGDGNILIDTFDDVEFFDIPDTGSLIDIRVTFGGLTSVDEDFAMDFLALVNDIDLLPTVEITSPTDFQVFVAGTTSVDIDYTITGTPQRVDIYVNGTLTSDIGNTSGTFPVTTSDGESYFIDMIVIFDGVEVNDYVIDFSVDSPLGIDENENKNFNIFPNPSSLGYININSKNSETITANVFDVLGKQVIIDGAVNDNRLDVINLSPGLYFIKLTQNNTTVTKKLIIK